MFIRILNQKQNQRGFTLVEIMVVVVIIGLIASLVGTKIFNRLEKAKREAAYAQMENFKSNLNIYLMEQGKFPDGLQALIPDYLDSSEVPLDPWKNEYQYEVRDSGRAFVITCTAGGGEPIVVEG
ncbi:type II secretion system protein GspG [bacterium]|nr:type II secretion system protein GspG [candidate division CSSED10-310 bacterium]